MVQKRREKKVLGKAEKAKLEASKAKEDAPAASDNAPKAAPAKAKLPTQDARRLNPQDFPKHATTPQDFSNNNTTLQDFSNNKAAAQDFSNNKAAPQDFSNNTTAPKLAEEDGEEEDEDDTPVGGFNREEVLAFQRQEIWPPPMEYKSATTPLLPDGRPVSTFAGKLQILAPEPVANDNRSHHRHGRRERLFRGIRATG